MPGLVLRVNLVAWGRVEGTVCWVAGVSLGVSVVVSVGWVAFVRVEGTVGWVEGGGIICQTNQSNVSRKTNLGIPTGSGPWQQQGL